MAEAERTVTVEHGKGLHARPATVFVETASGFESTIRVGQVGGEESADAKSSLAVMSLGVEQGDEIRLSADGPDSQAAVDRLAELVANDFELEE